ncbi:2904_t:CDS:1, partial [Cetraspora pellucida]
MNSSKDDLVFDYEILEEDLTSVNEKNIEKESDSNDLNGEEYKETRS